MTDLSLLTTALIHAHRTGTRTAPALPHLSRAQILAVQSAVAAGLGPVAGFKVARVAGGPPILAPVPLVYCVANGETRTVRDRLGIELEIGFELIRPLPSSNVMPARPQDFFRPCVVLELVDTRLTPETADLPDLKFADFQVNAGLVIGGRLNHWTGEDFGTVTARLATPTGAVIDGEATVPGGSALSNLALLLGHLGDHCGGLTPGQVVITGSLCGLAWFPAGTAISGHVEGLGAVAVNLVPASDENSTF